MNISHIKQSLNKKGIAFCTMEAWKRYWPIRWVRNIDITNQIFEERTYNYLKKNYLPELKNYSPQNHQSDENPHKNTIWICWLQGLENAPEIVKKCVESVKQHSGNYEVVIVTNENLPSLIDIPEYITKKLQQKKMQFATYSDYVRIALLEKYGGIWIDSTVFMTDEIPEDILSSNLFCFQKSVLSKSPILLSSWFLKSEAGNPIISQTKYLFELYWQKENILRNYYLFHLLFSLVAEYNNANKHEFCKIPYYNNVDVHSLQFCLFNKFDQEKYNKIVENSFAHKLTYKFNDKSLINRENTFYKHIFETDSSLMISVIVCTYNRDKYLYDALKHIADNDFPAEKYEIVLVNNNSTDNTEQVCKLFMQNYQNINFRYFVETSQGLSYARNRGIKESKGNILLFLDDDSFIRPDYLKNLDNNLRNHPETMAFGGKITPRFESGEKPKWLSKWTYSWVSAIDKGDLVLPFTGSSYPIGANMGFRRKCLEQVGNFNTSLGRSKKNLMGGEEKDIFNRVKENGFPILYFPDIEVEHVIPPQRTTDDYIVRMANGIGLSERMRTKNISNYKYFERICKEIVKWGGQLCFVWASSCADNQKRAANYCSSVGTLRADYSTKHRINNQFFNKCKGIAA